MTDHDQFFKKLLMTFFDDLLEIVVPQLAGELRTEDAAFLMQEIFSDPIELGTKAIVDLVAKVPIRDDQHQIVLVHTEVEAQHRSIMAERMLYYYMRLRLNHGLPVLPIVINLRGGPAGIIKEKIADKVVGETINTFHYYVLGLERCEAEPFLQRSEPLAWGLAALMKPRNGDRAEQRFRCLHSIVHGQLGETREQILLNLVETYLELEEADRQRYDGLLKAEGDQTMAAIEMTWAGRIRAEGRAEGMREMLLRLAEWRFGPLPDAVRRHLEAVEDPEELNGLSKRLLEAQSLEELRRESA